MTHVVAAAVCMVANGVAELAGSGALSQLQQGDRLHVSYQSHGCFHERKYEIDFDRSASVTARSAGRAITLSPEEVAGTRQALLVLSLSAEWWLHHTGRHQYQSVSRLSEDFQ